MTGNRISEEIRYSRQARDKIMKAKDKQGLASDISKKFKLEKSMYRRAQYFVTQKVLWFNDICMSVLLRAKFSW